MYTGATVTGMMGRYFQYRMQPLGICPFLYDERGNQFFMPAKKISDQKLKERIDFGRFSKSFLSRKKLLLRTGIVFAINS